jgi:hypothetical protein
MPIRQITQAELDEIFDQGLILFGSRDSRLSTVPNDESTQPQDQANATSMGKTTQEEGKPLTKAEKRNSRRKDHTN